MPPVTRKRKRSLQLHHLPIDVLGHIIQYSTLMELVRWYLTCNYVIQQVIHGFTSDTFHFEYTLSTVAQLQCLTYTYALGNTNLFRFVSGIRFKYHFPHEFVSTLLDYTDFTYRFSDTVFNAFLQNKFDVHRIMWTPTQTILGRKVKVPEYSVPPKVLCSRYEHINIGTCYIVSHVNIPVRPEQNRLQYFRARITPAICSQLEQCIHLTYLHLMYEMYMEQPLDYSFLTHLDQLQVLMVSNALELASDNFAHSIARCTQLRRLAYVARLHKAHVSKLLTTIKDNCPHIQHVYIKSVIPTPLDDRQYTQLQQEKQQFEASGAKLELHGYYN